jgi:DNA replication and repair protein RecF
MRVDWLEVRNFRNIREIGFEPDPHINFFLGDNGQGKTSIVESLGILASLRSFRGAKPAEMLRFDTFQGSVAARVSEQPLGHTERWESVLKVEFEAPDGDRAKTRKKASVNTKPVASSSQYLSHKLEKSNLGFHAIVFNPADHEILRGDPEIRRAFLNGALASHSLEYFEALRRYTKALQQRNMLLKDPSPQARRVLEEFTEPLIHSGAELVFFRIQWMEELAKRIPNAAYKIAPQSAVLRPAYFSSFLSRSEKLSTVHFSGQPPGLSLDLLRSAFREKLASLMGVEREVGVTLAGPHRDDWMLLANGQPLKLFGSQGEVRSALLALKLCEIDLYRAHTGMEPVLLLDDFSSELDQHRRSFLLEFLESSPFQVFVTTTEGQFAKGKTFFVRDGAL